MPKALEGLRVIDLTQWEAGTSCTEYMGFMGADVIKIEVPGRGESARFNASTKEERENGIDSWYFILLNANKRGITLNLKSEKGVELFKEMVKKADVVVSNFLPGTMEKLGIDFSVLSKIKPDLVYAENSGFGKGGPYSAYPSFDAIAKAAGTACSNTGLEGGPPLNPGPSIGDTGSGMHMMGAIMAALYYRDRTGEGQEIDMAMTDNIINQNRIHFRRSIDLGEPQPRSGGGVPGYIPWDIFKAKGDKPNDYVFIAARQPHQYKTLMNIIGRDDLASDELIEDLPLRWERRDEIRQAIEAWTTQRDKTDVFHTLAKAVIPCAPILDTMEALTDPHFTQRGMIFDAEHPKRGKHKMLGMAVKMSKSEMEYRPAPSLGQHNEEVLNELFGYSPEKVAELKDEGII
jgi:formyl-CoA transferase